MRRRAQSTVQDTYQVGFIALTPTVSVWGSRTLWNAPSVFACGGEFGHNGGRLHLGCLEDCSRPRLSKSLQSPEVIESSTRMPYQPPHKTLEWCDLLVLDVLFLFSPVLTPVPPPLISDSFVRRSRSSVLVWSCGDSVGQVSHGGAGCLDDHRAGSQGTHLEYPARTCLG